MSDRIGQLFPLGGPVPPALVIGRDGDIEEIERRLHERMHTMLVGPRRIGKTTVCEAVCERLRAKGLLIVKVEVPERADAAVLLQLIVDRCGRTSRTAVGRRLLRSARPLVERILADHGLPLDLSELGAEPRAAATRTVLSLPGMLAQESGRPVVLFFDELQRAVTYADGSHLLTDLVDIYGGRTDVTLLVDGSDERALAGMLGPPAHFGKLCDRLPLDPTILPLDTWRSPLTTRFRQAGLDIDRAALELILRYGRGRPYETMAAARATALSARKLPEGEERATVGEFEAQMGVDEAARRLEDDGVTG
jgi:AAA ATPase domain